MKSKKKEGLHSNFVRFFAQAWKKRTEHTLYVIKPYAQLPKGGLGLNFAYFFMQFYNPGDPKWGAKAQCPPPSLKYAPVLGCIITKIILQIFEICGDNITNIMLQRIV